MKPYLKNKLESKWSEKGGAWLKWLHTCPQYSQKIYIMSYNVCPEREKFKIAF
jgi:hypothetical protein